jgi:hypothetical protein
MPTNINEAPNSLSTTTEYVVFYIQNVTNKIDFLFRVAVTGKKKLLRIMCISIVSILVIAVIALPVSVVTTSKSDTKATSTTTTKIATTKIETSTTGRFKIQ